MKKINLGLDRLQMLLGRLQILQLICNIGIEQMRME